MCVKREAEIEPELSSDLRVARRAIIGLDRVELLRDWEWHRSERRWGLRLRLMPDVKADGLVPPVTDWFVLTTRAYPLGRIQFNPAKRNGLTLTFHHQSYNKEGPDSQPWREGTLCLDTPARALGRRALDTEPFDADKRLRWHVKRAIRWLEAASRDELVQSGEPFELPEYPTDLTAPLSIAFSESVESFATWQEQSHRAGIVDFYTMRCVFDVQIVKSFKTFDGEELLTPGWGYSVKQGANSISHGLWVRLNSTPVLQPWQAPKTWGELRTACREQGVDLDELLRDALGLLKDKDKMGRIALIGFPIPSVFEGTPERMHWLALYLPDMAGTENQVKGFRPGKKWSWQHNRERLMHSSATLRWLDSENWFPDQLQTRGCLGKEMTTKKILTLGAGALGSTISELLVRGGMHHMLILDNDHLKAGNLVRHTLGLDDLNEEKAEAVAKRLNNISPFARVESITEHFPPTHPALVKQVNDADIVVDCSGWSIVSGSAKGFIISANGTSIPSAPPPKFDGY